ncbi:MAG: beta-lactamase regulating signal transducer with metallopeptidase domain, partial [Saprospiraceae bacterium]
MIPYMLHSSILLSGCFIFYWLFIRLETFFSLNRWVLISGILLSVLIPLIHIPENWSLRQAATSEIIYTEPINFESLDESKSSNIIDVPETQTRAGEMPVLSKNEKSALAIEKENSLSTAIPIMKILLYIYLIGVVVFFLAFLVQLIILVTKMYTLISFKDGRYRIVELVKDEAPYSFWNSIFINPTKYELEVYTQILNHEKIHIQQAHFIDKLLAEFLLIGFWFNPFVWMLRNAITNNLEYLTDSSMLEMGTEKQAYQLSLLKVSVPQHPLNLSTNYNNSFLKSRIAMMNSKKSSASSSWKYLFLLPLLGFSMVCLNEVQSKEANSYSDTEAYENYLQDSIPEKLEEIKAIEELEELEELEEIQELEAIAELEELEEIDNYNTNIRPGHWVGEIDGNKVCFEFNNSRPAKGWTSINHACFDKSALSDLPKGEDKDFHIKRAAGTMKFNGSFKGDSGDGTFEFEEDAAFISYLEKEGMNPQKENGMFHLFMNNVDKNYIAALK